MPQESLSRSEGRRLADGAVLRPARPDDVPQIVQRIRDLAAYEREPDAVRNTPARLHDVLFGDRPSVFAHVVERDGEVVGIAIWFLNYSTWEGTNGIYLEDLFVAGSARGRGYGLALMRELAAICVDRGYARFEWWVLDWNEPSLDFYRSLGATAMDEWTVQRLTGHALRTLASSREQARGQRFGAEQ